MMSEALQISDQDRARAQLEGMLEAIGLPRRASYRRAEVCQILGISTRTFWYMVSRFERCPLTGRPLRPDTLDSFTLRHERRVSYEELASFLLRNNTSDRLILT